MPADVQHKRSPGHTAFHSVLLLSGDPFADGNFASFEAKSLLSQGAALSITSESGQRLHDLQENGNRRVAPHSAGRTR